MRATETGRDPPSPIALMYRSQAAAIQRHLRPAPRGWYCVRCDGSRLSGARFTPSFHQTLQHSQLCPSLCLSFTLSLPPAMHNLLTFAPLHLLTDLLAFSPPHLSTHTYSNFISNPPPTSPCFDFPMPPMLPFLSSFCHPFS